MHHIKRLVLGLCLIAVASLQAVGQCTPDSMTSTVPGLYPDTLANGTIGQMYSEVITVVIPQDTMADVPPFGTLSFDICELQIDSIPNLPGGMNFDCLAPGCVIQVNHDSGVVNRTCVELFGTPTDSVAPDDTLNVFVSVVVGSYDAAMDTCMPVTIALPPELTTIQYRTRFLIRADTTTTSIDNDILSGQSVSLYPNPSLSGVSSLQYQLSERHRDLHARRHRRDQPGRRRQRLRRRSHRLHAHGHRSAGAFH